VQCDYARDRDTDRDRQTDRHTDRQSPKKTHESRALQVYETTINMPRL